MQFKMNENGFRAQFEYGQLQISGDEQYGFRPYQLLVSSVSVCSGGVLRKILDKQRIQYDDITLEAEVTRNEQGANEVQCIHTHFIVTGKDLDRTKIEKALILTRKNCPIVQSVHNSIEITESFELRQLQE